MRGCLGRLIERDTSVDSMVHSSGSECVWSRGKAAAGGIGVVEDGKRMLFSRYVERDNREDLGRRGDVSIRIKHSNRL